MAKNPRVLTLGLHPHLIAVPHRIPWLWKILDLLVARDDAVFMTGDQIADWFVTVSPPPHQPWSDALPIGQGPISV